jgi:hypothetical protein
MAGSFLAQASELVACCDTVWRWVAMSYQLKAGVCQGNQRLIECWIAVPPAVALPWPGLSDYCCCGG